MTRMQEQAQRKKSKGQGKNETYKEQNLPDQQIPVLTLFAVQVYLTLGAHGMLCSLRLEQILQSQRYVRSWSCPCTPRSLKNTKRQKVQCAPVSQHAPSWYPQTLRIAPRAPILCKTNCNNNSLRITYTR